MKQSPQRIVHQFFAPLLGLLLVSSAAAQPTTTVSTDMRAIQLQEFGGPEVLVVRDIPIPVPQSGEILVRVMAAGINPVDTSVRAGRAGSLSGAALPYVPGFDASGVVAATGPGVTDFAPGDEVFAMLDLRRGGAYAEYALVKTSEAAKKPARLSHSEAASIPLVALTAWQTLFEVANLQAGQTVLIHGGAGGVGTVAIQLAKWRGARVIATASDYNLEFLAELGVDVPVDYRNQRFEDFAANVDVILDTVGGETQIRSLPLLHDGGTLVSIVGLTAEARANKRDTQVTSILVRPDAGQLSQIGDLLQQGVLDAVVTYEFSLEQAPQAHEQSETRRTRGKIVLQL